MHRPINAFTTLARFFALFFVFGSPVLAADPTPTAGLLIWVPQTDEGAASWIGFLDKHPTARLVLAVSPRFNRIQKDAEIKNRLLQLQTEGRLVLALQIPNAPHLPLLEDSGTTPPYRYPDDVIQHLAQARGAFVKAWGVSPTGVILPYGAISPGSLKILGRSGFFWTVAAAGLPPTPAAWRQSAFFGQTGVKLWDATPSGMPAAGLQVRLWDDREMKTTGKAVDAMDRWMKEWTKQGVPCILPDDTTLPEPQSLTDSALQRRTWTQPDWSGWVGVPEKNTLWNQLRRTRETIEAYQNSGEAQMSRLDAALAELFTAQNSNYFFAAGNPQLSDADREDRQQEFQATLYNVFRLMGKTPPDDLFKALDRSQISTAQSSMTVVSFDQPAEGVDRIQLTRADSPLRKVDVLAAADTVTWTVTLATTTIQSVEIYIDINGLSGVGTSIALPRHALRIHPEDAWEYALRMDPAGATLYRTQSGGTFIRSDSLTSTSTGSELSVSVPRSVLRGSIRRWGYQVIGLAADDSMVAQLSTPRFARLRSAR